MKGFIPGRGNICVAFVRSCSPRAQNNRARLLTVRYAAGNIPWPISCRASRAYAASRFVENLADCSSAKRANFTFG